MSKIKRVLPALLLALASTAQGADLDHSRWDALLKRYVNAASRVDYRGLKEHGLGELDAYLGALASPWPEGLDRTAVKAAEIDAYNALTVRWILTNYPVESIWQTHDPFRATRHTLDGKRISLDQIEARLRELHDPRIHAALVCAGLSCPPLRREAYVAGQLDAQLDDNARRWLADASLNRFSPERQTAVVSEIFKWYAGDFAATGGVRPFLARFAPPNRRDFIGGPNTRLEYENYRWGVNDSSALGSTYTQWSFYRDSAKNGYLIDDVRSWFLDFGEKHGVNPIHLGTLCGGAILLFAWYVVWLIRNLRRGQAHAAPGA